MGFARTRVEGSRSRLVVLGLRFKGLGLKGLVFKASGFRVSAFKFDFSWAVGRSRCEVVSSCDAHSINSLYGIE